MVDLIQHIEESVINAIAGKSKITDNILNITGMSSIRNRHLLNNLLDMPDVNYLEIGLWEGSTFISALYNNNVKDAYAIDDWSHSGDIDVRGHFLDNCERCGITRFKLIDKNCYVVELNGIKSKINVFFYDADHSRKLTRNSIFYYYNVLADEFLYIVDDYDWDKVSGGVDDAIAKMNLDVLYKKHLQSNGMNDIETWWNGIGIFIFKKR